MNLTVLPCAPVAPTPERLLAPIKISADEQISPSRGIIRLAWDTLYKYGSGSLLTLSNPKTDKSVKYGYLTAPLHLAPGRLSGYEVCPGRSAGCTAACLHTAGNKQHLKGKTKSRIAKTRFWIEQPDLMRALLSHEIGLYVKRAKAHGLKPCVRLNATSDVVWERMAPGLFIKYDKVKFYDYTKIVQRCDPAWKLPRNYHLTFSRSESNEEDVMQVLAGGGNAAVVFGNAGISAHPRALAATWRGYQVVDGDKHDLRFLDPANCVVALRHKGRARQDKSGFVVYPQSDL